MKTFKTKPAKKIAKVTASQVEAWIGSDNMSDDYLLSLIADLANNEYNTREFRKDVLQYGE